MKKLRIFPIEIMVSILLSCSISVAAEKAPDQIRLGSKINSMKKADVGVVLYPHKLHEELYECSDCHPAIFKRKIGANDIDMQKNIDGKFCGASGCHNSAEAFPLYLCENCHTRVGASTR